MMQSENCFVGTLTGTKCHLQTYSKSIGNEFISDLPPDTRETLMWRTGVTILSLNPTICFHHKYVYLNWFAAQQKSCCDPVSTKQLVEALAILYFMLFENKTYEPCNILFDEITL